MILKFDGGYHGHADFLLAKAGSGLATDRLPDRAGVPRAAAANTPVAPYNDLETLQKIFEPRGDAIAAIIVEPIAGHMGVVPPTREFLHGLRAITQQYGALLIFDKGMTGFRVAWGGAQALYQSTPDLTCFGKIIGGGLPVGAYGGRRDRMQRIAPLGPMYQAGTLSGNPLAMAAGIATLDAIAEIPNAYTQLETRAAQLERGLHNAAQSANVPVTINRVGSLLTAFFMTQRVTDYTTAKLADPRKYARWFFGMLERGIYLAPSQFEAAFVSLAHTEADIVYTIQCAAETLESLRDE